MTLPDGHRTYSTDAAEGSMAAVVYPWDVTIPRELPDGSAQNLIRGAAECVMSIANRVRVTVGPVTAEVSAASAATLNTRERTMLIASWKAAGTRLVELGP